MAIVRQSSRIIRWAQISFKQKHCETARSSKAKSRISEQLPEHNPASPRCKQTRAAHIGSHPN
jgi:hypothetical protein